MLVSKSVLHTTSCRKAWGFSLLKYTKSHSLTTQLSWYIELLTAYFQFNIETTSIQAQFYIDFRLSQFQFNIKNMRIAITFLYFIYCTSILKASPATGRRTLKYDLENEKGLFFLTCWKVCSNY